MKAHDQRLISQCDIGHGCTLQRVVNAGGEKLSLILKGTEEIWSCPTRDEAAMLTEWDEWGWRAFA